MSARASSCGPRAGGDVPDQLRPVGPGRRRGPSRSVSSSSQAAPQQDRHLRREDVVVAEGDLVGRGGVVLVDHRDRARARAAARGSLRALTYDARRRQVAGGQQHLRGHHAVGRERLGVALEQHPLPHRRRGLQVGQRGGALGEAQAPEPAGDRAAA